MKTFFAIIFILLIGLLVINGCASTSESETKEQTQQTQPPEQQEPQPTGKGDIPEPPALPK